MKNVGCSKLKNINNILPIADFPGALGVVFRTDRVCLHKVLLQNNAGKPLAIVTRMVMEKVLMTSDLHRAPSGHGPDRSVSLRNDIDISWGCFVILLGQEENTLATKNL